MQVRFVLPRAVGAGYYWQQFVGTEGGTLGQNLQGRTEKMGDQPQK